MTSSTIWPKEGDRRISAAVYTDEDIYKRELQEIFYGPNWNYVGLACEVPNPGDFIQTTLGEMPIIVSRDRKGVIRAFINRCPHRGATLCQKRSGNNKTFTCPYHEWRFNLEGRLVGVPFSNGIDGKGGMSSTFDPSKHGLTQLYVTEKNGVIFATTKENTPSLEEYLGPKIQYYFDRVCDGRKLKVIGKLRHIVNANWKLQIENVKDSVHAAILHSFFTAFGIWRSDQETHVITDGDHKNSVLVSTASFNKDKTLPVETKLKSSDFSLNDPRLVKHEKEFSEGTGAVMTIWPNLIFLQQLNCLVMRHVRPDGPSRCIKTWTFFLLRGRYPHTT